MQRCRAQLRVSPGPGQETDGGEDHGKQERGQWSRHGGLAGYAATCEASQHPIAQGWLGPGHSASDAVTCYCAWEALAEASKSVTLSHMGETWLELLTSA